MERPYQFHCLSDGFRSNSAGILLAARWIFPFLSFFFFNK
jgi:hypothetical protein